jgi:CRP-like cAMP-binding protein
MITLFEALARCDLFAELSPAACGELAGRMRAQALQARDQLFQSGDVGSHFFVVLHGALKVTDNTADGAEVVLSVLGPGMSFGEIALIDGGPRSASVHAIAPSRVASLDRAAFAALLDQVPGLKDQVMRALCRRIRQLTGRVEQLARMDVSARLANVLLGLADDLGSQLQGRYYLPMRLSQSDLGAMVGASRESVNKLLKAWEGSGWLDIVDGRLQLLEPKALLELAASPAGRLG